MMQFSPSHSVSNWTLVGQNWAQGETSAARHRCQSRQIMWLDYCVHDIFKLIFFVHMMRFETDQKDLKLSFINVKLNPQRHKWQTCPN